MEAERKALREVVWDLLAQRSSSQDVHRVIEAGNAANPELDHAFAELGLFGVDVPESYGGGGGTATHLWDVVEGCGRAVASTHILGTSVGAVGALMACPAEQAKATWLPALAEGTAGGAVALERLRGTSADGITVVQDGDDFRLWGQMSFVPDLMAADMVVVAATGEHSILAAIPTSDPTVARERHEVVDLTRSLGRLTLKETVIRGDRLLSAGTEEVAACVDALLNRFALAVAADSLGAAYRVLELTTAYLKERQQFGRAVGSFQAVKHQAADMYVRVETARALVEGAAEAFRNGQADAPLLVSMAKQYSCSAAAWVAGRGIQLHGGIGYTWEHDMHIFFKRVKLNEMMAGDDRWHRRRIEEHLQKRSTKDAPGKIC